MNTMKLSGRKTVLTILTALVLTLNIAGVSAQPLSGTIIIDGSSTVFPITEAVA
ncbi:MAG: protein sphX, partial [Clostridia bacterium]|nr:protein sphX [Clostridia bacterium]